MDVQKKKFRKQRAKHFALNTLALTLLTLQAKTGRADNCTTEIIGISSTVCDFAAPVTSVTVTNGASVGGISMLDYTSGASQILIDSGGSVSNTDTTGIAIAHSSLSNGLINNGTIHTGGIGILVTNTGGGSSDISGGITNNGTIDTTADPTSGGTAIKVSNSTVHGGISNSGTITIGSVFNGIAILTSTINGGITNTGTIDGRGDGNGNGIDFRLSTLDNISNSGLIEGGSAGILFTDVSHLTGDLSNTGSIIATGDASIGIGLRSTSEISGALSNSGTISGTQYGLRIDASSVGSISNTGKISGGDTGISITSESHVTGGISNSGTIQGDINAINIDSTVATDINILGSQARVIGNVEAAGSNFNVTSGSTFTSEGTFDVNNFNIASNAVFNMANTITAHGQVTNAGTLSVGNTAQTISSTGGYVQSAGGVFQTKITDGTHYGQLTVDNNVDLSASGNINVQLTPTSTIHSGEVFSNIISSGGTLTGPTDGFNVTDNSFIWKFIANATSSAVDLTATVDPAAYGACQGSYCQGAANTIIGQVAAGNAAFDPYGSLATSAAFKTAASQATPELTNENNQALQFITSTVMNVLPMGDPAAYRSSSIWAKPYSGTMTQNENNSVPGFNGTASGIVVGRDKQLTNNWLVGGALAAGKDSLDGNAELSGQSIHSNTYQAMLYGVEKLPGNLYFAGQGLVGYGNNDTSRSIPLYGSTATGSYSSWFTNMRGQLGWNAYMLNQNLVLTPEVDASYLFVHQNAYKESGSVMDLSVNASHNSSLMLGAYGNAAYRLSTFSTDKKLTLTGYVGVARDVLNNQPQVTANFVAGGPSFSTYGTQPAGFVFRGGAGLMYGNSTKPWSWSLNYDLQTGNNDRNSVGSLTIAYKMS